MNLSTEILKINLKIFLKWVKLLKGPTIGQSVPEHESHVMTFHEPLSWNHLKINFKQIWNEWKSCDDVPWTSQLKKINLKKFEMKETIERTSN